MTYATALKPTEAKTCATCPNFNNHLYSKPKGWCEQFNLPARSYHEQSNDCISNTQTATSDAEQYLNDLFAQYSPKELEALREEAFPTEVIELDSEGYPMGEQTVENAYFNPNFEQTVENAYFNPNFVTSTNEPF